MKKYFREGSVSLLLTVGLSVVCFSLINAVDLPEKVIREKASLEDNQFNYSYALETNVDGNVHTEDKTAFLAIEKVVERLSAQKRANISFSSCLYLEENGGMTECDVLVSINEPLKMRDMNDNPIEVTNNLDKSAILGETIAKKMLGNKRSDNFIVNGEEVDIAYIVQNSSISTGYDDSLYLIWNNCSPGVKEEIVLSVVERNVAWIYLESDSPIDELVVEIEALCEENGLYVNAVIPMNDKGNMQSDYEWDIYFGRIFVCVAFAFSMLTCFSISEIWIKHRKKELVIRNAFGYTKRQILKLVLCDFVKLSVPSFVLAFVMQIIYNASLGIKLTLPEHLPIKILMLFGGMSAVLLLILQHSIRTLGKYKIADELRGE